MIYRDKSVGNLIRISVVKLVLLKAGDELSNFTFHSQLLPNSHDINKSLKHGIRIFAIFILVQGL